MHKISTASSASTVVPSIISTDVLANPMIGESAVSEESVDTVECDVCADFVHYGDPGEYGNTGDPGE